MAVSYATLARMRPQSFVEAAGRLARSATGLQHAEHGYDRHVVRPLGARHGWHGGGQPDASIVAQVEGLAIGTVRLRVLAGRVAFVALAIGMATARQQLESIVRKVESAGMTVDDDGSVAANPSGDIGTDATYSRATTEYENEIRKVLSFATHVDGVCAAALGRNDDQPVSTQNADPGILERALDDYGNAAGDLASASNLLFDTIERSTALDSDLRGRWDAECQRDPTGQEAQFVGECILAEAINPLRTGYDILFGCTPLLRDEFRRVWISGDRKIKRNIVPQHESFVVDIIARLPVLQRIRDDHVRRYGRLFPYLVFEEFTEWFLADYERHVAKDGDSGAWKVIRCRWTSARSCSTTSTSS
ncbi:MAG: hypothetical protein J2P24_07595 [Streptosporangiales bacterium]|nr:hypothetical protein [Streptosporangiales bacterium]